MEFSVDHTQYINQNTFHPLLKEIRQPKIVPGIGIGNLQSKKGHRYFLDNYT